METLKSQIKSLSAEQKELKNQRKTVHIVGERTMEPYKARWEHEKNRYKLRNMFAAYAILRGKELETVDKNHADLNMDAVNKIVAQYEEAFHPRT